MLVVPGELRLTLGSSLVRFTARHDAMEDVVGRGLTPVIHDQAVIFDETRLAAEYGIGAGLGIGVTLPFRVVATKIVYRDAVTDAPVTLAEPNIHHRNETLTGLGDPAVTLRAGRGFGDWQLDGRAGVTLPLGRTEEDPFRLGDMGLPHEHIQLGSGTFNLTADLEVARRLGRWRLGLWGLTQQTFYEDGKGYQAGDRYAGGLTARLALPRWWAGLGLGVQDETAERWHGAAPSDDGNRGRLDVLAGAELGWHPAAALALALDVKVPLHTEVVGGQLSYPLVVGLAVSMRFGGAVEHHHEHPEELGDQVTALVPEPGKLTVFDFWAEWCVPCKELSPRLAALERQSAGRLVVKRIDVGDWHSPVAQRFVAAGGFDLPHLKLFDASGKLVWEKSGSPAALAAAVEAALR